MREGFSERDVMILELLADGWTQTSIAPHVGVSRDRIKEIVEELRKKLDGATNATQAVAVALRKRLIK